MSDFYIGQRVTPTYDIGWYCTDDIDRTYEPGHVFTITDVEYDDDGIYGMDLYDPANDVNVIGIEPEDVEPIDGFKPPTVEFAHVARNRRLSSTTSGVKNLKAGTTVEVTRTEHFINIRRLSDGLEFRYCEPDTVVPLGTPVAA